MNLIHKTYILITALIASLTVTTNAMHNISFGLSSTASTPRDLNDHIINTVNTLKGTYKLAGHEDNFVQTLEECSEKSLSVIFKHYINEMHTILIYLIDQYSEGTIEKLPCIYTLLKAAEKADRYDARNNQAVSPNNIEFLLLSGARRDEDYTPLIAAIENYNGDPTLVIKLLDYVNKNNIFADTQQSIQQVYRLIDLENRPRIQHTLLRNGFFSRS